MSVESTGAPGVVLAPPAVPRKSTPACTAKPGPATRPSSGARPAPASGIGPYVLIWGIAVAVLLMAGFALQYKTSSELVLERSAIATSNSNLLRALQEHSLRTLKSVDQAVLFLKFQYEKKGAAVDIPEYVREGMIISSIFNQLGVIDEKGMYILSNIPNHKPMDLSDREHFRVHVAEDTNRLFVSKPVLGRASGKWSIQLTRRVNKPDGSFGGVVVVSLDPYYFTSLFSDVKLGANGLIALVGADGIIRARRSGENVSVGQNVKDSRLMTLSATQQTGEFTATSPVDGVTRMFAFRKLPDFPLMVLVGVAEDEALADFRERVSGYYRFGAVFAALVLAFALAETIMIRRQRAISRELAVSRDRAEEANRLKSEFLASISHELRTPLNGIIGYAEYLRDVAADDTQREFASTIFGSSQHLLELVNSLLDLAKIEAGKLALDPVACDCREIADHVMRTHQPTADRKQLAFSLAVAEDVPRSVLADRTRLIQVMNNLVHNALKFTESGSVTLSIRRADDAVRFSVSDTGPGIAPEHLQIIFEKFRQAEGFITRKHGGTGLGLALSTDLVGLMGGRLEVQSEVGAGSTFHFDLPLGAAPSPGRSR